MGKILKILIAFSIFASSVSAEIVNKIEINGNKRISDETIKVYGEIELNKDLTESDLNKILINLYKTDFFENVDVKLSDNILVVNVNEYPVVNQLIIIGEKSNKYKKLIRETLKLKEKRPFVKSFLAQDIEIIKNYIHLLDTIQVQ